MSPTILSGHVDDQHRLIAEVPDSIPPGPVTITILPREREDEAGIGWQSAIAIEWAEELGDAREDLYTLSDGDPVHEGG